MPVALKPTRWVWLTSWCMQYLFSCCVFIKTVSHSLLFCTVLVMPSLTCLGSQQPVDPRHSIECINRTKYTVGTVGISELFCSVPGAAPCQKGYFASLIPAQPSSVRRGLRGLFSSASESHCVVSAFPRGSWALPCGHAEILCALANGLLWKPVNGFRHTLSQGPPRPLLGFSLPSRLSGPELSSFVHGCPDAPPPDTVIPPQTLPSWFPSPLRCFQTSWKLIFSPAWASDCRKE